MPREKKSRPEKEFDSQRETRVLLEEIHSEVKTVSEQHGSIMEKLQEHDQRFEKIDGRLDKIELKLIAHDAKFSNMDEKFSNMDAKFSNMDARFDRIEKVITGVMSDHETRIKKLEEKVTL